MERMSFRPRAEANDAELAATRGGDKDLDTAYSKKYARKIIDLPGVLFVRDLLSDIGYPEHFLCRFYISTLHINSVPIIPFF